MVSGDSALELLWLDAQAQCDNFCLRVRYSRTPGLGGLEAARCTSSVHLPAKKKEKNGETKAPVREEPRSPPLWPSEGCMPHLRRMPSLWLQLSQPAQAPGESGKAQEVNEGTVRGIRIQFGG